VKICHLIYDDVKNPWLGGGGALRAREIYGRLAGRHQITVVTGNFPGAAREEVEEGVRFVRVGTDRSYARSRLSYCREALACLRRQEWDVWVHEFSAFAPLWPEARLRQRGLLFFYHFVGAHALVKHPVVGGVAWAAEALTLRGYRHLVTISPSVQEEVRRRLLGRPVQVDCVYTGVDARYFDLQPEEQPYLLYFGRMDVHTKGLDTLIAAFALVAPEYPQLQLRMAGRGAPAALGQVRQLLAQAKVEGRVELLGAVDEAQKGELLRQALFLCMPSRYEGWGIAAVEAQAAGKAVLGTRVSGLRDAVREGETGLLVEAGQPGALADGMRRLLDQEELRQRLGQGGREWARRFDWDQIACEQEEVYLRAAAANRREDK
jgi:glycosyltransferase involved in cell wall biosynthesis